MRTVTASTLAMKSNKVSVESLPSLQNSLTASNKTADAPNANSSNNSSLLISSDAAADLNKQFVQQFAVSHRVSVEPMTQV